MVVSHVGNSESFKVTLPSDQDIRMTRVFNAPRHLVFEAMTRSEHIKHWRGRLNEDYSVLVRENDFSVGGAYRFVSRNPWGEATAYGEYREITAPSRFVVSQSFEQLPGVVSVLTTELTDEGDKTRMTVTARYASLDVRDMILASGMSSIAALSYDRLEELLAALQRS